MARPRVFYVFKTAAGRTGRATMAGIERLGVAGERVTFWRPRGRAIGEQVAAWAESQVGTLEVPRDSNSGPRVRAYQATTTVPGSGWAWCCAFWRWCSDQAGSHLQGYRGAYVPHLEAWARKAGLWSSRPSIGAACVMEWHGDGVADHVGIVVQLSPLMIVEGNAQSGSAGDQSNGGGVYRRTDRTSRVIRGYIPARK